MDVFVSSDACTGGKTHRKWSPSLLLLLMSLFVPLPHHRAVCCPLSFGRNQVHRCIRKDTKDEYAVKVIDKTSLSTHEKFLLRGEIGGWVGG